MEHIKKKLWVILGLLFLGIAYIGIITPGIPWSTPSFIAAYCFAKGSKKWHDYMLNHKLFGPFLKNWGDKKIYPTRVKWIMFLAMDISLIILWITTQNWKLCLGVGLFMACCLFWAMRYPGSREEWQRRKQAGIKIGWLK